MKLHRLTASTLCGLVISSASTSAAYALNYKSVGTAPAILVDTPSERGRRVFVAPRGMPVEVILTYGEWSKVRDAAGTLSWVSSRALTDRRHVVVNVANAKIYTNADEHSAVVFASNKSVLLELTEPSASGWLRVRHNDGENGYVRASDVWGN
jgi:SH3-like domain-containing protein